MRKVFFILVINFYACGLFESDGGYDLPNEKVYVALQAFDQVGIVDVKGGNIDYVDINYSVLSCSDHLLENDCLFSDECEWMSMNGMGHCMNKEDECMQLSFDECNVTESCEWMLGMNHCMEIGGTMDMGNHTPHFMAIDETNGFWFVSTISSGFIGRHNLETNELIDNVWVGDSPALLALNEEEKKIYVSRMMPMAGMMSGATSSIIQEIDYDHSSQQLIASNEFEIGSPAPHGLAMSLDGDYVFTVSNTADWLYKISTSTNVVESISLDASVGNPANMETQRLKPIQCVAIEDGLLLVSCSAGTWYNSSTGDSEHIPGQVQLWNTISMTMVDFIEFSSHSTPWHIVSSASESRFYVTLAGDALYSGSAGVACVSHANNDLELIWKNLSEEFFKSTLHGIDLSADESVVYVSGRGDDYLHVFDSNSGTKIKSIFLGDHAMSAGIKSAKK